MLNYDFNRVNLNSSFHLQGDSKRFSVPYKKLTKRRTGTFHTANLLRGGEEKTLLPVLSIVLHRFSIFPSRLISVRRVPVEWMESICKTWRIFILSTRNVAEICMDWLSHAERAFRCNFRKYSSRFSFLIFRDCVKLNRILAKKEKKEHCCDAIRH